MFSSLTKAAAVVLGLMLSAAFSPSQAQEFPGGGKTVRLVVGYSAGPIPPDAMARYLQPRLQELWKTPVIVENRPGAAGILAANQVTSSAPDGYTLMITASALITNSAARRADTLKGLRPIMTLSSSPVFLHTRKDSSIQTVQQLIEEGKKGKVFKYGSTGYGSGPHLAMELFSTAAGIKFTHVPFNGYGELLQAFLGGHIELYAATLSPDDHSKAIVILNVNRSNLAPNVPSVTDLGFEKGFFDNYNGTFLSGPANLPDSIVKFLYDSFTKVLTDTPELRAQLLGFGSELSQLPPPDQTAKIVKQNYDGWVAVADRIGLKLD